MHHSFFPLRKIQERKKEDSLYRFEQFTKRKAVIFHADDEIIPEILESTRLEEDLSREDRSKNTDCILFTESFVQTWYTKHLFVQLYIRNSKTKNTI